MDHETRLEVEDALRFLNTPFFIHYEGLLGLYFVYFVLMGFYYTKRHK
jgi:hypothetical protein